MRTGVWVRKRLDRGFMNLGKFEGIRLDYNDWVLSFEETAKMKFLLGFQDQYAKPLSVRRHLHGCGLHRLEGLGARHSQVVKSSSEQRSLAGV